MTMNRLVRITNQPGTSLATVADETPLVEMRSGGGRSLAFRVKTVRIGGEEHALDAQNMMRMIRRITQSIGEYKAMNNAYAGYVVPSLRKCRGDMVADLEEHFGIHFEITAEGKTVFFV